MINSTLTMQLNFPSLFLMILRFI